MYFVFENNGVIDIDSIKTFGVSSKETPGAIGFFGTGLKYAISILLRHGCSVQIQAGDQTLTFSTERGRVRVDEFDFVTMNGERLGFTTELGKTWEVWQAFREIFCNCKDENGAMYDTDLVPGASSGMTRVIVSGEKFHDVWSDRSSIILESTPIAKHQAVNIHGMPSKYMYYRGVRAYELSEPSLFTYDIQRKLDLSEDRTIKYFYTAQNAIREGLLNLDSRQIIRRVVFAEKGTLEHDFEFAGALPGQTFLESVLEWKQARHMGMNPRAFEAIRPWVMERLHKSEACVLSDVEQAQLDAAADFCEKLGYPVRSYPTVVSEYLGENILGLADEGTIYLSRRAFMMGTKMVAGTLLEEYLHLFTGFRDGSRDLQNFLVDAVMTIGERYVGEKL